MADAAYVAAKSQSEAVKQVCDMIGKHIERICKRLSGKKLNPMNHL